MISLRQVGSNFGSGGPEAGDGVIDAERAARGDGGAE
jgi:hypothetical protein